MTSLLRTQLRQRFHTLAASLGLLVACGGSNSDGLFNPVGGTTGAGSGGGGATSFGGSSPAGGSNASGGTSPNKGGGPAAGGSDVTSGGMAGGLSGGAGGSPATGGSGVTGGSDTSGGTPSSGGGGAASGGAATGGSTATGGEGSGGDPGGGGADGGGADSGGADSGGQGGGGGSDGCEPGAKEICDGLDNDCNGRIDNGIGLCPTTCKGVAINGEGYMFCMTALARMQEKASSVCADNGMHLAWIDTAEENAAIVQAATDISSNVASVWIGATDAGVEGEWRWVEDGATNGTQFWSGQSSQSGGSAVGDAYANWGPTRPDHGSGNEDCVAMTLNRQGFTPGDWDDEPCSSAYGFICEGF